MLVDFPRFQIASDSLLISVKITDKNKNQAKKTG